MATVRFSLELTNRILNEAKKIFADRIRHAEADHPNWSEEIYELMFAETSAGMDAMPTDYFSTDDDIILGGFSGPGWELDNNIRISMKMSRERRFPRGVSSELHGLSEAGYRMGGYLLSSGDPRWDKIKAEYKTYYLAVYRIKSQSRTFSVGVKRVLGTYATLSPALRAWPALWDLIPEDVRERHREVKPRSKASDQKAELDAAVDLDSLTGSVAARKLTR